jgi:hypothetical protein
MGEDNKHWVCAHELGAAYDEASKLNVLTIGTGTRLSHQPPH